MSPIWETKIDPADDDVIADTRADTAMLMRTLVLLMMLVLMTVTTLTPRTRRLMMLMMLVLMLMMLMMLVLTMLVLMMLVLMTVTTTVGDKVVRHSLGDRPTHGTQFRQ